MSEDMKRILNLPIGQQTDFKLGLSTYTIYRHSYDMFILDYTGGGWITSELSLLDVRLLLEGKLDFLNLKWI